MSHPNTEIRRCHRVIRMVSELHRLGYQRLRILPYFGPSAWRCEIGPVEQFSRWNGAFAPVDADRARYTGASGNIYFDWQDAQSDNARTLAEKFILRFPRVVEAGRGRDWQYAGWLAELVGTIERGNLLPFVMAEYYETKPYSLRHLPIRNIDDSSDLEFPLPPAGELDDDAREHTGSWGSHLPLGLELAMQQNYLGSPDVVRALVTPLIEISIQSHDDVSKLSHRPEVADQIALALSDDTAGYTRMPGWHTPKGLGANMVKAFDLDAGYHDVEVENLRYLAAEGLLGVSLHISEMLKAYDLDPAATWDEHGLDQLRDLGEFVVAVLLGTNTVSYAGKSLRDFAWKPVVESANS